MKNGIDWDDLSMYLNQLHREAQESKERRPEPVRTAARKPAPARLIEIKKGDNGEFESVVYEI